MTRGSMGSLQRVGLWFVSFLLAVSLFSTFFSTYGSFLQVIRITLIFASPVWLLYLPFVFTLKDAEQGRIRTILLGGTLIGPAAIACWGFLLQLGGSGAQTVWEGDPLIGIGGLAAMFFALVVGLLTSSFYVIGLKIFHRLSSQRP